MLHPSKLHAPLLAALLAAVVISVPVACKRSTPTTMTFELVGLHQQVTCEGCHRETIGPLPTDCVSCHIKDRPADHYSNPCGQCHTEIGWPDFSMHSFLPVQGGHSLECASCHASEDRFDDLPGQAQVCASCHDSTRPEDHFGDRDCISCHVPSVWGEATKDHSFFPLEGSHELDCVSCHSTGDPGALAGQGDLCESCHERPTGHFNTGTSCFEAQDCSTCHEITSWPDAVLNHNACSSFPTQHEAGSPRPCGSCHLDAPNYRSFDCNDCHSAESNNYLQEWNGEHDSNVSFTDQNACLDCHPDGDD